MKIFGFIFAVLLSSCTHFIIETETRIRMENNTDVEISNLSLISKEGNIKVLIPETVGAGDRSKKAYDNEWVGKFTFAVFAEGARKDLGVHELKGGSVLVIINKDFTMEIK